MKKWIVNILAWALRLVVVKIVAEMPKPKTMGDAIRERALRNAHLAGDCSPETLESFKNYWNSMVYCRQGKKQ